MNTTTSLAIFASGSGTNARAIIDYFKDNAKITVSLIITNKEKAGVIDIARANQIPYIVINKDLLNDQEYLINQLKIYETDFIVLAGFLLKIPAFLVKQYTNRMINIHPALLPDYGGKGMYGKFVHEAVIKNKEQKSGITIHYVTEEYDEGNIIFQAEVPVSENESCDSLEEKIHRLEHTHFPKIIKEVIESL